MAYTNFERTAKRRILSGGFFSRSALKKWDPYFDLLALFEYVLRVKTQKKYWKRRWSTIWPKYFGQTVIFLWGSALREAFNFDFSGIFYQCWQNFDFGGGTGRRAAIVWSFEISWYFLISEGPGSFGKLWYNWYVLCLSWNVPCLLLIITIRFTCGDTKTLSNIKMSKNIMSRIVDLLLNGLYFMQNGIIICMLFIMEFF